MRAGFQNAVISAVNLTILCAMLSSLAQP